VLGAALRLTACGTAAVLAAGSLLAVATRPADTPAAGVRAASVCPPQPPSVVRTITRPRWLPHTLVTEYFPVRESWFTGRAVRAAGLPTRHRVDWLYGPHGVAMNGEGLGLDGRVYHFAGPYDIGWVNGAGRPTRGCWNGQWSAGPPSWLDVGWRNRSGGPTYPQAGGGWSNGPPHGVVRASETPRFQTGSPLPMAYWKRVAVDPRLIPLGSRVFIPAYCATPAHGWFVAGDTGGAIVAHHVDVFRTPPRALADSHALWGQTIFVIPAGTRATRPPSCA
jgi:3D (Asp-Asp-Asp) domain-containing protein